MSNSLACVCEYCDHFFENPVFLPCSNSICQIHITMLLNNGITKLECNLCDGIHLIPNAGFLINKTLDKVIKENLHLANKQKEAKILADSYLSLKLEYINLDGKTIAVNRIESIRKDIISHKNHVESKLNKEFNETLSKLNQFKEKILNEIENKPKENILNDDDVKLSIIELRKPNLTEKKIEEIESILKTGIEEINMNIKNYGDELFSNNPIKFMPNNVCFGEIKISEDDNSSDNSDSMEEDNNTFSSLEYLKTFDGHKHLIRKCLVLEHFLITASDDNTVRVWNLETAECLQVLDKHKDSVTCLNCLNLIPGDTNQIITGSSDKSMQVWKYNYDKKLFEFVKCINEKQSIVCQSFTSNNKRLLINGLYYGKISVWSFTNNFDYNNEISFDAHKKTVTCLITHENNLISSSNGGEIKMWKLEDFSLLRNFENPHKKRISALELLRDKNQLISGSDDKYIKIWNLENGICIKTINNGSPVYSIKLISNNQIAIGGYSGDRRLELKIIDFDEEKILKKLVGHESHVFHLELFQNRYLFSTSSDKTVKLWKLF